MMSDATTDWISPFWLSLPQGGSPVPQNAQVWLLNPGGSETQVRVSFLDMAGVSVNSYIETLAPRHCMQFLAEAGEIMGWCHITSQHPVMPWGLTGWTAAEGGDMGFATMNFYRAESGLLGEIEVTPI
jgi:hypothetical protein